MIRRPSLTLPARTSAIAGISPTTCPPTPGSSSSNPTTSASRASTSSTAPATPIGLFSVPGTLQQLLKFPSVTVSALPAASIEATWHLRVESVERFSGDVTRIRDELDQVAAAERVLIACHNDAEVQAAHRGARGRHGSPSPTGCGWSPVTSAPVIGWSRPASSCSAATSCSTAKTRPSASQATLRPGSGRKIESRAIDSFLDLAEGDLVVHVSHGIARYRGMQMLDEERSRAGSASDGIRADSSVAHASGSVAKKNT